MASQVQHNDNNDYSNGNGNGNGNEEEVSILHIVICTYIEIYRIFEARKNHMKLGNPFIFLLNRVNYIVSQ